jgi:hypothetical protein
VPVEPDAAAFAGGRVERPAAGESSDRAYEVQVRGWAVGRGAPVAEVELRLGSVVVASATGDAPRADLARDHPGLEGAGASGFYATISSLSLPREFELEVRVRLEDGETAGLAVIRGRRAPLRRRFEPRRAPVMLTSPGRTGSTVFMRMLEGHPEIVAYPPFEHEPRVASYWFEVFRALAEPASYIRQVSPAGALNDDWWLGRRQPVPRRLSRPEVQEWLAGESVEALGAFCMERIEGLYDQVEALSGGQGACYFAEKFRPDQVPALAWELYPGAREVILVRDLRDMVASIFAAGEKRGVKEVPADRARYVVEEIKGRATAAAAAWQARSDRAHLLRYEDLMLEPERTLVALLAYLGLDATPEAAAAMREHALAPVAAMEHHRTTPDPAASIGRWRRDLPPDVLAACEQAMGEELALFGYS